MRTAATKSSVVATLLLLLVGFAAAQNHGHYIGTVKTEWLPDGRNMKLLSELRFVDPNGVIWIAPKGSVVDGASIPRFAWSLIGGPFEGNYRDASVIHDVACDQKARSWESVHLAFYNAMLTSSVNEIKAKTMYAAVYHFGPRWGLNKMVVVPPGQDAGQKVSELSKSVGTTDSSTASIAIEERAEVATSSSTKRSDIRMTVTPNERTLSEDDFTQLKDFINTREQTGGPSLEEIRNFHPSERNH